jgi:serine protease AprX
MQRPNFLHWIKRLYLLLWIFLSCHSLSNAQTKKVIYLTDKKGTPYSLDKPQDFLSNRAIQRRVRYQIPVDSSDLPCSPVYESQIAALNNVKIIARSKWLNALIIESNDATSLAAIQQLPFVQSIQNIALRKRNITDIKKEKITYADLRQNSSQRATQFDYGASERQINLHNGHILHNTGATGQTMMIALFDAGFWQYDNNRFLDSAVRKGQIVATRDFYQNDPQVNEDDAHGLWCLSVIAAKIPGEYIGSCPDANYLLLRTEDAGSEQIIEEYMWGIGAEYADSCGADVFSSSVGYTTFDDPSQNHQYADLDGNTVVVTKMADKAAQKGILVVTSAGNEGGSSWKYIGTPADGDSVFAVGAVNLEKQIAGFSSFGPTKDGRIKPDGLSVGQNTYIISTSGNIVNANGTSFSTPNLAGLMACLWELFPNANNAEIMQAVRASSDRYNTPQPQYGYGIPDMTKAMGILIKKNASFSVIAEKCSPTLQWKTISKKGMAFVIQRKLAGESAYTTIDTLFSTAATWSENIYSYEDDRINNNASYRILQYLDTIASDPLYFILDSANVSVADICRTDDIVLYPNPAKDHFNIRFLSDPPLEKVYIDAWSVSGKKLAEWNFAKPGGTFTSPDLVIHKSIKGAVIIKISDGNRMIHTETIFIP